MYTVLHLTVQSFLSTYIGKICTVSVLKRNYITMKYFVKHYVREVFLSVSLFLTGWYGFVQATACIGLVGTIVVSSLLGLCHYVERFQKNIAILRFTAVTCIITCKSHCYITFKVFLK